MPSPMLFQMVQFEWRWQVRRVTFATVALVLIGFALIMIRQGYGPGAVNINSPHAVMQSSGLLTLCCVFLVTVLCVNGVLRDDEYQMHELVLSKPIGRFRLMSSRLLGVISSALLVVVLILLVQLAAPYLIAAEPERVGPLRVAPYLWTLCSMFIPNVLLITAILYAMAAFTRSTVATYVGGVLIFVLYMVTALLVDSPLMAGAAPVTPEALARAAVLDPFGLSAFFETTRYWTPAERNSTLLPLRGRFLLNRVLWLSVTALMLGLTYRFAPLAAARGDRAQRRWWWHRQAPTAAAPRETYAPVTPTAAGVRIFWHALLSGIRVESRLLFGAWVVQALIVLWIFLVGMEVMSALRGGEYGTRVLATSALLTSRLSEPLMLLGNVCVVYFTTEVVWRERIVGFDALIDATPATNAAFYLAKLVALCAIPFIFTVTGLLLLLGIQLARHEQPVVPIVYVAQLWLLALPLMLRTVAVFALQLVSANRFIGLAAGLVFMVIVVGGVVPALDHPLLAVGDTPRVPWSDLDGFGPVLPSFVAIAGYWICWSVLIAMVSWGMWRRGFDRGVWSRVRGVGVAWGARGRLAAMVALAVAVSASGAIVYQTMVRTPRETDASLARWRVDYERAYRHVASLPQPSIVAAELAVDLMPEQRSASVRGALWLENRRLQAIDSIWIMTRRDVVGATVQLGNARLLSHDARFGAWLFALEQPLLPGASRRLDYSYAINRGGVRLDAGDADVAENGSYLTSTMLMPTVGYRPSYEEDDMRARARAGLSDPTQRYGGVAAIDSLTREARRSGQSLTWMTLRATVSTAPDQHVVGPGRAEREWTAQGRRFITYSVTEPMTPTFAVASARYVVKRATQNGVQLEVWHHPTHSRNVDRMMVAAQRALSVLGERFGAYPNTVLRMAEIPSGWPFGAFAASGVLYFTEDRGMLADARPEHVDLVTRRVAHEVAHQWWGHRVDPLNVTGATLLVESLAKYSEQLVVASLHGEQAVAPILAFDLDRYLNGRADDVSGEPLLRETTDESYLYYGKGALAFNALRPVLGDSTLTRVLAAFAADEEGPRGAATAVDLQRRLRDAARSPEDKALVDEWFGERVLYDVRADSAWAWPVRGGYHLGAVIRVDRIVSADGTERSAPASGTMVELLVTGEGEGSPVLYRGQARAEGGRIHLSLELTAKPAWLEVDPMVRKLDRERSNNRVAPTLIRP